MLHVHPKLDYLVKSRFMDYPSSSRPSLDVVVVDGMEDVEQSSRHADNSSPFSRMRMDSPSSESMDSAVESCHTNTRKRRRGVIEKRRRDRINNSLAELRRLVPSAFEKQGSAKLEKAEILQLTVDHLKTIHTKGSMYHPSGMDPYQIGYQECMTEIDKFCQTFEGLPQQDPIKTRLLSHLQMFINQRESYKQTNNPWHSSYPTGPTGLTVPPPMEKVMAGSPLFSSQSDQTSQPSSFSLTTPSCLGTYTSPSTTSYNSPAFPTPTAQYAGFPSSANTMQYMNTQNVYHQSARPYRPWGGHEMAYC